MLVRMLETLLYASLSLQLTLTNWFDFPCIFVVIVPDLIDRTVILCTRWFEL